MHSASIIVIDCKMHATKRQSATAKTDTITVHKTLYPIAKGSRNENKNDNKTTITTTPTKNLMHLKLV